jgi:AraC-like DNA-binding protein
VTERRTELKMRSQLVAPALARVVERGGDAAALVRRFGLSPSVMTEAETIVPLATLHALVDAAAVEARDDCLGLHLAASLPRGAYGVVEYASRSAPTIREAIARLVRYIGLLNELVRVGFEERDGAGIVEQWIPGEPRCVGRHANEFFIATLVLRARALSGAPCVPERAWFAHAEPGDVSQLQALLGIRELQFDAGRNGLALPAAVLDLPLASADPALLSLLERQAEQDLAGRPDASRLIALVRRRIRDTLVETPPSLGDVASALKMSPRTLQRRLGDEGTRFADLVDEVRRDLALGYVRDRRRPLGEIAYLLGYAELSPFLRAFKRWTGKTPAELRDR